MQPRLPLPKRQPNPALKGTRGYALACFPKFSQPAPLSSGVGRGTFINKHFLGHTVITNDTRKLEDEIRRLKSELDTERKKRADAEQKLDKAKRAIESAKSALNVLFL